jgi:hypothetical protein
VVITLAAGDSGTSRSQRIHLKEAPAMPEHTRPRAAAMITQTRQTAGLPDTPSMTGSEANPMQPPLSHQLPRERQLTRTSSHQETDMNRIHCIHRIRRFLGVLAGLAGTLLAFAATGPAALAEQVPPAGGGTGRPPALVRLVTEGGMAGWQITLIALGAALIAAIAAVFADRALAARRAVPAPTA